MVRHGIEIDQELMADFCQRNRIRKLSLFGSFLRDDFSPESDIDVLVEFAPDARVGFFKLFDLERELSGMLGGRNVEISTPNSLSQYIREAVLAEAEVQYEQA